MALSAPRGQTLSGTVCPYPPVMQTAIRQQRYEKIGVLVWTPLPLAEWHRLFNRHRHRGDLLIHTYTNRGRNLAVIFRQGLYWLGNGFPMICPYLLAICWHHPAAKQTASHQQRAHPGSYFLAGIVLARIWVEFSIIELPNCKLLKRVTCRVSYTT